MADITLIELVGGAPVEELAPNMQLFFLQELGTERLVPPDQIGPPGIRALARLGMPAFEGRPNSIAPAGLRASARLGLPALQGAFQPAVNPTIDNISPAAGSVIAANAPWTAEISLASTDGVIKRLHIAVSYANLTSMECAYQGDDLSGAAFTPDFNGASSIIQLSPTRWRLTVIRNGGWPAAPRIFVSASTDRGGLTLS